MTAWDSNSGLLHAGCVLWPSHSTSLSLGLSICQMGRSIVPNAYVGVRVKGSERRNVYQCLAHSKFSISGYYYLVVILLLNIENTGADMKLRGRNYKES